MKKLYLAVVRLWVNDPDDGQGENKSVTTLVWGQDEDDARTLIDDEYNVRDQWVENVTFTEALGSQL